MHYYYVFNNMFSFYLLKRRLYKEKSRILANKYEKIIVKMGYFLEYDNIFKYFLRDFLVVHKISVSLQR